MGKRAKKCKKMLQTVPKGGHGLQKTVTLTGEDQHDDIAPEKLQGGGVGEST
jgi:hypothetical protein